MGLAALTLLLVDFRGTIFSLFWDLECSFSERYMLSSSVSLIGLGSACEVLSTSVLSCLAFSLVSLAATCSPFGSGGRGHSSRLSSFEFAICSVALFFCFSVCGGATFSAVASTLFPFFSLSEASLLAFSFLCMDWIGVASF